MCWRMTNPDGSCWQEDGIDKAYQRLITLSRPPEQEALLDFVDADERVGIDAAALHV